MTSGRYRLYLAAIILGVVAQPLASESQSTRANVPVDAVAGILDAFRSHEVVMLGHPHGNEQKAAFQLTLLRDARFAATVNDIVECGNSRYQDVIDRFVRGHDVPYAELRRVWEDALPVATNCDLPMYEGFFRVVRDVNAALPRERQLRVLLGEVPIDWDEVKSYNDIARWEEQREPHTAALIRREVLAKGRRALVLYGEVHAQRKNERANFERADLLAGLLERDGVTSYLTSDGRLGFIDGKPTPIPREHWKPLRMEDQFDAILYLGPSSAMTFQRLSPARCADQAFLEMRFRRMSLVPQAQGQIDRLKRYCAGR